MNNLENSQAPYNFGVCASADCTKRFTCLRYIALRNASPQYPFLPTLSPRKLESMKGKCEYYRPNTPVRYARGFTRVAELLTVRVAGTFRLRLISYFGRKNYYLARKGEYLIDPTAQQYIVSQAEALGLRLDDYFDEYVERYDWWG